jgi:hypothetical protein
MIGYYHQRTVIDFAVDVSTAIRDYFLRDLGLETDDDDYYPHDVPIYFKDLLLEITTTISKRFFSFADEFPCSVMVTLDSSVSFTMLTLDGQHLQLELTAENVDDLARILTLHIDDFREFSLGAPYETRIDDSTIQTRVNVNVTATFSLSPTTNIVELSILHTRDLDSSSTGFDTKMSNPLITFPLTLLIAAGLALVLTLNHLFQVYRFSQSRAKRDFQKVWDVVTQKVDKWSMLAVLTHVFSIVANSMYMQAGLDHTSDVPAPMVLMAVASGLHCTLLIRYLHANPSTMLIVKVTAKAGVFILQFLVGCAVIWFGYVLLGCCMLGNYNPTFANLFEAARTLIAIIHGDSLQDLFDAAAVRPGISYYWGLVYLMVWVFFSLTIMFNISISIFEEVLQREITDIDQQRQKQKRTNEPRADWLTWPSQ